MAVCDRDFVVDNVEDGYDLYQLDRCEFVKSFVTRLAQIRQPKAVEFVEEGKAVVGGSDHGLVYIFATQSGALLDVIRHAHGMVQTVAVSSRLSKRR